MEIYVHKSSLSACEEPLLAIGMHEKEDGVPRALAEVDSGAGGLLSSLLESGDFRGKAKEVRLLYLPGGDGGPRRLLLVGLGPKEAPDLERFRRCVGAAVVEARKARAPRLAFALPLGEGIDPAGQARAIVEAATLSLYDFDVYRSEKPEDAVSVDRLTLVSHDDTPESEIGPAVSLGRLASECANFGRDLANTPGGDATPTWMADRAREVADRFGLEFTVLDRDQMEARNMGGLLGVAKGSEEPPKLAVLEHNADRDDLETVCLVGKGVTFDSGGISIKPGEGMGDMKFDKCGACVVIATMRAVAALDLPLRVIGITPLVENMPSGTAYRPGDVLRLSNGKTVEVINTDAEGRLILADSLVYAAERKPAAIVDLATLTGACVVGLGKHVAGVMTPDDALSEQLLSAGERSGERLWRLPLFADYREQIKSNVADMKNLGGRDGGAITAACLLKEFVGDVPWAHVDIAGVSWRDTERDYLKKGGTGFGVRMLVEFLRSFRAPGGED